MHWLQTLDDGLFRLINSGTVNPVFDWLMPLVSANRLFIPLLVLLGILMVCMGGKRGQLCLLMLLLVVPIGDGFVCNNIKHAVGRSRPFLVLPDVHLPAEAGYAQSASPSPPLEGRVGEGRTPDGVQQSSDRPSGSMPSAHAANWFAATMVAFIYYRRSLRFMLPMALLVSFSRVYNGVHYPSDVLAGAILGAGYAAAGVWSLDRLWNWAGTKWFPLWWRTMPRLLAPEASGQSDESDQPDEPPHATQDAQWLRLGYLLIALLLGMRLAYIASNVLELTGDEAYQWLWSKHLALSYYSKPPLIAYAQFLGTSLWGDTAFGVRFFSPVCAAVLSLILLRFFAREINARAGFFLVLVATATPLLAVGSILMTVDPFSVLFWTAAMIAGWRAVQSEGNNRAWLWTGLWMGLGLLSKYTELLQWLCWVVFFILWPPARRHLRRPGLYLAMLVNLVCALPVVVWNSQHHWITAVHVAGNAQLDQAWKPLEIPAHLFEFLGAELGALNPVFFVLMIWAAIAFWRRGRQDPRLVFFFSMGAPLFLVYLMYTFHSRVLPNWIAPSVLPLFCLMMAWWDRQIRMGATRIRGAFTAGLVLGLTVVVFLHNTEWIAKVTGRRLPVKLDLLHRGRGWKEVARLTGEARNQLLAEGKPAFIIADDYRLAGEISFYLPEARPGIPDNPLVYCRSTAEPEDQFFFWPGYSSRKGENAILVSDLDRDDPRPLPPLERLVTEFESIAEFSRRDVLDHDRLLWPLQFMACRGLK